MTPGDASLVLGIGRGTQNMAQITGPAIGSGGPTAGPDTDKLRKDTGARTGASRPARETSRHDEVVLSRQARDTVPSSPGASARATASLHARATRDSAPARSLDARGAQDLSTRLSQAILARPAGAAKAQANTGRDSAMAVLR